MNQKLIERFNFLQEIDRLDDQAMNQQRGHKFEELINDVFTSEGSLIKRGFHTSSNRSEQIDGAIEIWNRILLLEVKWVSSNLAASELFSFIGKIDNKFQGSLGVFISRNRLSENFVSSLNRGRRQNVIVVHGEDIDKLFSIDGPNFSDYLAYCIKVLSYDNITHFPVEKYIEALAAAESIDKSNNQSVKDFVFKSGHNSFTGTSTNLPAEYLRLSSEAKQEVFRFALDNYSKVVSAILPKISSQRHKYLGPDFFAGFSSDSQEVLSTVDYFYNQLLHRDYMAYGQPDIFELYRPLYTSLSPEQQKVFEARLVSNFKLARKDQLMGLEADIVIVAIVLWSQFSEDTLHQLVNLFLEIFTDYSILDIVAQKVYARSLLINEMISKDEIKDWLSQKAKQIAPDYNDQTIDKFWVFQEELLDLFVGAYGSLGYYIDMDQSDFAKFSRELLEKG